jgi:hypothetical protein
MRYMMLIYSQEDESATAEELQEIAAAHHALMEETALRGIFRAADPLKSASVATTVRVQDGKVLITDGPFVETKEQLAGYYILDCQDLDDALEWAARIPTACRGRCGYIEVRPIHEIAKPPIMNG